MTIKEQFQRIKENWLIVLLVAMVLLLFLGLPATETFQSSGYGEGYGQGDYAASAAASKSGIMPSVYYDEGFAPEEADRKITKTASLTTEVERGTFQDAESKLKGIVKTADALLLNENVQKYDYGGGRISYYSGTYTLKVEEEKYAAMITQLKEIGEVTWFS